MGGKSPAPRQQHYGDALLSHVPGSGLPLPPPSDHLGEEAGWLGPDGSFVKRTAIVGMFMAAMGLLVLLMQPRNQPAMCREFVRKECFWTRDGEGPFTPPRCGKHECAFGQDAAELLDCPFASSGSFRPAPAAACDAGEEDVPESGRILPTCNSSCCVGDAPGHFYSPAGAPGRRVWQADVAKAGCSYFHYTSGEVLERLSASRTRLLVAGDSIMHQLWVRFVALMREQRRPIDFRIFTHARYSVCREGDLVTIARRGYSAKIRGHNATVQHALIEPFFRSGPPRWPRQCRRAPLTADLLHAPTFRSQIAALGEYLRLLPRGQRVVLVVGVGAFEKGKRVPPKYLEFLDSLAERGVHIVVVATPTKAAEAHPDFAKAYRRRNKALRAWAAERRAAGPPGELFPAFADFDALSRDANAPPLLEHDTHWMCYARYTQQPEKFEGHKLLRDRRFGTPVVAFQVPPDAACRDDMNKALLTVIFNVIMKGVGKARH